MHIADPARVYQSHLLVSLKATLGSYSPGMDLCFMTTSACHRYVTLKRFAVLEELAKDLSSVSIPLLHQRTPATYPAPYCVACQLIATWHKCRCTFLLSQYNIIVCIRKILEITRYCLYVRTIHNPASSMWSVIPSYNWFLSKIQFMLCGVIPHCKKLVAFL